MFAYAQMGTTPNFQAYATTLALPLTYARSTSHQSTII